MGSRLDTFPQNRRVGTDSYRLRVGDYRVVNPFNIDEALIDLISVGHRREIYRQLH
ncbi:MAG: hypothetical protein EXS31_10310 [Pedosphaera sp.]|nr:hypothetical protein [Pedosphaera sp.]